MQRKSDVDTRNGNRMMLKNQAVEFKHHAKELSDAVKKAKHVDAWVVAKAERATTDLSDITHYLEGQSQKMSHGGEVNLSKMTDGEAIEHANKILISELGEGAESMFFDSGYAARRFIREYHVRPVEITEEDVRDYFDDDSSMSDEAKEIVQKYSDIKHNADTLAAMRSELEEVGYTFDYDKDNVPYLLRDKMSQEDTMAKGGMMANGGVAKNKKDEIEEQAQFYADDSKWSTKPTISEYQQKIADVIELKNKLDNKEIKPRDVIGTGFKPQYARGIAYEYIHNQILIYERVIEILREREKSSVQKTDMPKKVSREDIQAAIDALEILAETGNEKAKDAIEGMKLLLEDLPKDSRASTSGGNDEDYIINMLKGKYYKVIPEGMQDSDIVVEIKDVRIDDPKYRERFVNLTGINPDYDDLRIPLKDINDFIDGEEIVLRDDKEYYAVKLMGNLAKGGIMAHGGQIESKRDELLDSLYPEIKDLFAKNGLKLDEDYGFTDGSNKSYLPYFSHQRVGDTLQKVVVSYYEDGYEVIGEIEIELEYGIEIEVEFPSMGIKEKKEGFMAKGGITGGFEDLTDKLLSQKIEMLLDKVKPYKFYFVDEDNNTLHVGFDDTFSQDAAMKVYTAATSSNEFFDADEVEMEFNPETGDTIYKIKLKHKVEYAKGGMMKKVGATFAEKVNAISARLDGMIVPSRLRKDYGRRYNKAEAKLAAQRIAGAMRKKGY